MKLQIRNSVFETNSSSTHSLTMTTLDFYQKFKNGEMLYDVCNNKIVSLEEGTKINSEIIKKN